MKNFVTARSTLVFLLGLLLLSVFVLSLGKSDSSLDPSALNPSPTGLRAASELLTQEGYQVKVDRAKKLSFSGTPLVVIQASQVSASGSENEEKALAGRDTALRTFVEAGGKVLLLGFPRNFIDLNKQRKKLPATNLRVRGGKITFSAKVLENQSNTVLLRETLRTPYETGLILRQDQESFLSMGTLGKGTVAIVSDPTPFCNRYIGESDHAGLWLSSIRAASQGTKDVVFYEGFIRSTESKGLLAIIGPWAVAGWNQALILFAVIIWSLNMRFGFPEEQRGSQSSSRELVDALGFTMERGRQSSLAGSALLRRAEINLRLVARAPRDLGVLDILKAAPETLEGAYSRLEAVGSSSKTRPRELIEANQIWNAELKAWKADRKTRATNG